MGGFSGAPRCVCKCKCVCVCVYVCTLYVITETMSALFEISSLIVWCQRQRLDIVIGKTGCRGLAVCVCVCVSY